MTPRLLFALLERRQEDLRWIEALHGIARPASPSPEDQTARLNAWACRVNKQIQDKQKT